VEAEDNEPVKKTRKTTVSRNKGKTIKKQVVVDDAPTEKEKMDEDEGNEDSNLSDKLTNISGIKPKVYLKDGAEQEVKVCVTPIITFGSLLMFLLAPPPTRLSALGIIITGQSSQSLSPKHAPKLYILTVLVQ
jgi:hypothetical protein